MICSIIVFPGYFGAKLHTLPTHNRVIRKFNWSFGRELVDLHTVLSMFSEYLHAWSQCGGLNEGLPTLVC
jgi:hypothetical protein